MCKYQKQCLAEAKTEQAAKNNSIDKLILYSAFCANCIHCIITPTTQTKTAKTFSLSDFSICSLFLSTVETRQLKPSVEQKRLSYRGSTES